uniref:Uncharacterized protein n=1 Tax=Brassica oleracea TaxID=3712 RepID=A0A3P6GT35_BRAOL|nr:unnamed protein product [Brassica oleracea]
MLKILEFSSNFWKLLNVFMTPFLIFFFAYGNIRQRIRHLPLQ